MTDGTNEDNGDDHTDSDNNGNEIPVHELIDDGMGTGSRSSNEDYNDEHYTQHPNDGRSKTKTTFFASDVDDPYRTAHQLHRDPEDRRGWKKLADWNDGVGDPGRGMANHAARKRRDASAYADGVGLTKHERGKVVRVIDDIDVRIFGIPHTPTIEQTIISICGLVRDENAVDEAQRLVGDETFERVRKGEYLDDESHRELREQLVERTDHFDTGTLLWGVS